MIRWITERLGTGAWSEVPLEPDIYRLDARDLVDKGGNVPAALKAKIDAGVTYLQQGARVVVCCDYGISRSNAVAAGILAVHAGIGLDEAIRQVLAATGETSVRLEVLSTVRRALDAGDAKPAAANRGHRLLVTGAAGFIGSALLRAVKQTHQVIAPTHQEIDLLQDTVRLDLLVKEAQPDILVHLAAPRVYTTNQSMGTTLCMMKNVLDVCVENDLRLIYLSGWEVYSGYRAQELRADEALAPRPAGTYGQTKLLCECLIEQHQQAYGLRSTILRSSPVYGAGGDRPKFIWNFLQKALHNEDIVAHRYRNGLPMLDLLHVDDLCRAIAAAIEFNEQGHFNLGTGVGKTTTEVARWIIERVHARSAVQHLSIDAYASNVVMDAGRAAKHLGWAPMISLDQGLQDLLQTASPA